MKVRIDFYEWVANIPAECDSDHYGRFENIEWLVPFLPRQNDSIDVELLEQILPECAKPILQIKNACFIVRHIGWQKDYVPRFWIDVETY